MKNKKMTLWACLLLVALLLGACAARSEQAAGEDGDGLTILASQLDQEPTFIDVEEQGVAMQLIARKDETGAVRLAFNTCQSCGGSPYAWFEYLGDGILQCQNCGLKFPLETVGTTGAAGCNPMTITEFTVEGDTVTVPDSVLAANVGKFVNWKHIDE